MVSDQHENIQRCDFKWWNFFQTLSCFAGVALWDDLPNMKDNAALVALIKVDQSLRYPQKGVVFNSVSTKYLSE